MSEVLIYMILFYIRLPVFRRDIKFFFAIIYCVTLYSRKGVLQIVKNL